MTNSRRYKWQTKWTRTGPDRAQHACGLVVALGPRCCAAINGPETVTELAERHGGHNAPRMVARLLWEAETLFLHPPPV